MLVYRYLRVTDNFLQSLHRSPFVHNTRRGSVQFVVDRRSSSRGWKKFISHEAIMAPGGVLLHDGALLIRCALEIECREGNTEDMDAADNMSMSQYSAAPLVF